MLVDTHCHIHWSDYPIDADVVLERARRAGVTEMICVGTNQSDSRAALEFATGRDGVFASVGVHPHHADDGVGDLNDIVDNALARTGKLVAIGEIGLDYYKCPVSHDVQKKILIEQIEIALKHDLPIIFHVRDAYDDFWPIFDSFKGIRGVLHCFTDTVDNVNKGIDRGLYIGINGISTFTKDIDQQKLFAGLPLQKTLLETDAPLLTPSPFRGKVKVNEPAFVREIAEHCGLTQQISLEEVASTTTANARALFNL
jgi:TatD DNase family protein